MTANISEILAGSDDEALLHELYTRIETPCNPAQALFVDAWELSGFIASDGFEFLFEQERSLDEFAQVLLDIGFPEAKPVFEKVKAVVPDSMLAKEYDAGLRDHLTNNFDRLKALLYEYLELSDTRLLPTFGDFIRKNKESFADQLT
ncbi:hypothetical protein [Novipirellula sp.]|uniref:hypothetical protein n=1 Tax=Novipirellula sp. TaxID=2795430 RepID=UPI003569C93F